MNSSGPTRPVPDEPTLVERAKHPISRRDIDTDALKVLYRLHRYGHIAYLVGGAVRDLLLGRRPADFDVATDARPNRIKKLFANAFLIGRRFRLAHIRFQGGKIIEVSTFRQKPEADAESPPGEKSGASSPAESPVRKPIAFGTPREDAFRRDITINALYYDIATFSVIDYVGGLDDLKKGRVRIIGDPDLSYREDPVRIWRVLRHAARLNFSIEENTAEAIPRHRHLLADCPGSRLFEELNKDMKSGAMRDLLELLKRYGLLPIVFGKIGEKYEKREALSTRIEELLGILDRIVRIPNDLSQPVVYSLLLWPWVESLLDSMEGDKPKALLDAYREAGAAVLIPKGLLLDTFQTLVIADEMMRALVTGRMRWALKKRAHYGGASLATALITQGQGVQGENAFERLYNDRFPARTRRRKKRKKTIRPSKRPS